MLSPRLTKRVSQMGAATLGKLRRHLRRQPILAVLTCCAFAILSFFLGPRLTYLAILVCGSLLMVSYPPPSLARDKTLRRHLWLAGQLNMRIPEHGQLWEDFRKGVATGAVRRRRLTLLASFIGGICVLYLSYIVLAADFREVLPQDIIATRFYASYMGTLAVGVPLALLEYSAHPVREQRVRAFQVEVLARLGQAVGQSEEELAKRLEDMRRKLRQQELLLEGLTSKNVHLLQEVQAELMSLSTTSQSALLMNLRAMSGLQATEAEERQRRQGWLLLAAGVAASIPTGIIVNLLTAKS